ncbi:hypothetical protein M0811_13856 [Anaeramoeba ignava]|uniref:TLDc domain-containing protein n=1 Tax=Anaeramoeba ignava TaxID=1746090 RepID=A0A9Q0LX93_ANAIG|nr:hypothetical protein M0811_13856 [Anaeramoeba ignava]
MDKNNNNQNANQIENENQNQNENEMKNLEKKVTKNLIKDYSNLLNGNSFKDFSIFVENKSNPFEIKEKGKENEIPKSKLDRKKYKLKVAKIFSDSRIVQDIEYAKKLQEWINDNDFFSKMKKGFSAKRDGFNSKNWHKAVDGKGKTLVIIKTKQNFIFGGFTKVGFNGDKGNINDSNAFIFSLRNDKGDRIPAKFTIKEPQYAINSYLNHGPFFGNGDFLLGSDLKHGLSQFGSRYNLPNGITYRSNEAMSYLAGSESSWVVDEVESYFI